MSDEIKLIDKIKAEILTYKGYSLSYNPFPEMGKAPQHPPFCAGRNVALNKIYDFIADVYTHESVSGLVVLGTIGGGKTHILRYVRDKINNELRDAPSGAALAVYIENPQTGVLHIYSEFMKGVDTTLYTEVLWKVVSLSLSKQISKNELTLEELKPEPGRIEKWLEKEYAPTDLSDLTKNLELLREQIANGNLSKKKIENKFLEYLGPHILEKDVLICSIKLLLEDDLSLLNESWKFICGLRLNKDIQKILGLLKPALEARDITKSVFKSMINIFKEAGYRVVFLLLDEVETFASFGPHTRFAILDEFRGLFDSFASNFGLILACAPRDWQQIVSTYPALRDRIKHVAELGYMQPEEAIDLVAAYLSSARIGEISDTIYPFSKDAIFEICRLKRGVVRYIVEACHTLLREGAKQNFETITKRFVSKHIKPAEATLLE